MPDCESCKCKLEKEFDGTYYCLYCDVIYPADYFAEEEEDDNINGFS